jgi:hypothetical protein
MNSYNKERPKSHFKLSENGVSDNYIQELLGGDNHKPKPQKDGSSNVSSLNITPKLRNKSFTRLDQSDLNPEKEVVRDKLKRIFEYYASFGDKLNLTYLKSHGFQKFVVESGLIDQSFTKTRLELIFTTETKPINRKQLDFAMFLSSLIKISDYKYLKGDKKDSSQLALNKLLKLHVLPLYDRLFGKDEINVSEFQSIYEL